MQRCVGPCGRLLYVSDFPRKGLGKCWDCFRNTAPTHEGHDKPASTGTARRGSGRVYGF